ncbi:MAG: PhoH family protein [Pseudomonadota bacterium]
MVKRKLSQSKAALYFDNDAYLQMLFGPEDNYLRLIEKKLNVEIFARGREIKIEGDGPAVQAAEEVLSQLYVLIKKGHQIIDSDIEDGLRAVCSEKGFKLETLYNDVIDIPSRKTAIMPRSKGQRQYIKTIGQYDVTFSIGPAGTGKTFLACAMAVAAILRKEYQRLVLARPAVEAGEKLGFLPGNMIEKVNPYLRPLYDALYDMLDMSRAQEMLNDGIIEIAPFAFMRGRTLSNAFVIIDEAQNATTQQMKMCLTRMGTNSKMVVNGDITQIDLPNKKDSGLLEAWRILKGISDIGFQELTEVDIVRHPLVGKIVKAYDKKQK